MFAALRTCIAQQRPLQLRANTLRRCFATETPMPSNSNSEEESEERQSELYRQFLEQKALEKPARPQLNIPVEKDHGLFLFFRQLVLDDVPTYETVESKLRPSTDVGRDWNATELRRKSFKDLHTLWYIVLRERNLLATQKAEAKRLGINDQYLDIGEKDRRCRKTMARIKTILSERMHAYEDAYAIQRQQRETAQKRLEESLKAKQLKLEKRERWAALKASRDNEPVQVPSADPSEVTVEQVQPRRGRITRKRLVEKKRHAAESATPEPATASSFVA